MAKPIILVLIAGVLVLALGCSQEEEAPEPPGRPAAVPTPAPVVAQAAAAYRDGAYDELSIAATDRLIVRAVNTGLLVDDVSETLGQISALAVDMGGFVVSSRISGEEEATSGSISIRVPADRTDDALSRLRVMAVKVTHEVTSAQDVTEEYVDLEARLRNLERTEEQYLRLFERADNVEELLQVQRELSQVQGQIEQLKGRKQYLERSSATSLITAELRPASSPEPLARPGWSPGETLKEAVRGLSGFGQGLVNLAIRIGVFAPVWVPALGMAWWLQRRLRRRLQPA